MNKTKHVTENKPDKFDYLYWAVCAANYDQAVEMFHKRFPWWKDEITSVIHTMTDGRVKVYFAVDRQMKLHRREELGNEKI